MGRPAKKQREGDESIIVIEAKTIFDAITKFLENQAMTMTGGDLKKAQEVFSNHYRLSLPCEQGVQVSLFWHEDLDEVQARMSDDPAICIAAIGLNGLRGAARLPLMTALRRAMDSLGFRIGVVGATWQQ